MIKCIVIDDEKQHRDFLRDAIAVHLPGVEIIGEATSVVEGIKLVDSSDLDILFLDVQMPPHTGFDLLKAVTNKNFEVVFTTSFDSYAIDAIRFSAFDFLLKPYGCDDLCDVIERYRQKNLQNQSTKQIENLLHNINEGTTKKKIGLSDKSGIEFFEIDAIVYCKSENVYTTFYFDNKTEIVTSKSIKDYEKELGNYSFFRIHNSYLINLHKVKKYIRGEGGQVVMSNGATLDVSRTRKDLFLKKLGAV